MEDKILETVINNLEYTITKDILVKPLEAIKIVKTITEPKPTGKKDAEGNEEYEIESKEMEVESDFAKGIIISLPTTAAVKDGYDYNLGDVIVYPKKFAKEFELFKDSMLVKPYDVVALVKK